MIAATPADPSIERRRVTGLCKVSAGPVPLRIATVFVLTAALYALPGRDGIAPMVAGDNAYIFMAADRLFDGHGLTSLPPVAPLQPWEYTNDWGFLTQWPPAYPFMLCGIRWVTGVSTVAAAKLVCVLACAVALVGWYTWIRRAVGRGLFGVLLAVVGAASAVSVAALINPATDTLLVALLPWLLLVVVPGSVSGASVSDVPPQTLRRWFLLGVAAGLLVWVRYAAIFVAVGLLIHLFVYWARGRRTRAVHGCVFIAGAAVPLSSLVMINRGFSLGGSVQQQVNLGSRIGFDLSADMFTTAWWQWTNLPFYNHLWYSHWALALGPIGLLAIIAVVPSFRRSLAPRLRAPAVVLSLAMVAGLFATLMLVTAVFGSKYDYVSLDRYYLPVRPLYFVVLAAPLSLLWRGWARLPLMLGLLLACSWYVQQEWPRPYLRWQATRTETTAYGRWATTFSPDARAVYEWLGRTLDRNHVVFSNFHDEIALETGHAALPLPRSREELRRWTERVCAQRRIVHPKMLFIIDADYHHRDYYLPSLPYMVATFELASATDVPEAVAPFVFRTFTTSLVSTEVAGSAQWP